MPGASPLHVFLEDHQELLHDAVALERRDSLPSTYTGAFGSSNVPGSEMPMLACFDSPGPFTTQPITATRISSTPGCVSRQTGICSRRYFWMSSAIFWKTSRRAAAAGARRHLRREAAQPERLQNLLRDEHFLRAIAAGPRRQRNADRVADALAAGSRARPRWRRRPSAHPGFGESEVQRVFAARGEPPVHVDQILHGDTFARSRCGRGRPDLLGQRGRAQRAFDIASMFTSFASRGAAARAFSSIIYVSSSWSSEPQLTPMRTGLSVLDRELTIVRKFSSCRLPPTLPGLMRYLARARGAARGTS